MATQGAFESPSAKHTHKEISLRLKKVGLKKKGMKEDELLACSI